MIGNALKDYMKENGIKQVFVSEKTGMSPQVLGQLLNGQRKIEVSEFFKICEAIGLDPLECARKEGIYKKAPA